MPIRNRHAVLRINSGLHFSILHFARGSWPTGGELTMSVNRALFFECGGPGSSISGTGFRIVPTAGLVCLIPAGCTADVTLDNCTEFVSIQFRIDLFFGEDLIGGRLRSPRAATLPELTAQAVRIFSETTDLRADIQAQMLLLETAEALQVPLEVRSPAAGGRNFVETLDLMNRRCTAELTVNELADFEGMSRGAFSREFARRFGIPPKQYLERMLMRRAETLLRQQGMNVRTTAERLRFSSEFYFSRFFRRHAGVSPDEFRRRVL